MNPTTTTAPLSTPGRGLDEADPAPRSLRPAETAASEAPTGHSTPASPPGVDLDARERGARTLLRNLGITLAVVTVAGLCALALPWYRATLPERQVLLPSGTSAIAHGYDVTTSAYGLYHQGETTLPLPGTAVLPPPPPAKLLGMPAVAVLLGLAGAFGIAAVVLASPPLVLAGLIAWFMASRQLGALQALQNQGLGMQMPSLHQSQYGQSVYTLCSVLILGLLIGIGVQAMILRQRHKAAAAAAAAARGEAPAPGLTQRIGVGLMGGLLRLSEQSAQAQAQRSQDQIAAQKARAAKAKG